MEVLLFLKAAAPFMENLDKGVWVDERKAWIASKRSGDIIVVTIDSEVEPFHLHGGSGSSTPYGPQDTVSEKTLQRRKAQQLHRYFQHVIRMIKPVNRLLITGPAEARIGLEKEIGKSTLKLGMLINTPSDSMTENQFRAMVLNHFEKTGWK